METIVKSESKTSLWIGRILSSIVVLFMSMDGIMKLAKPVQVIDSTLKLGWNESSITGLGVLLLACTLLYAFRKTSFLGAILLTGYLGGAIATHVRIGQTFPIAFATLFGLMTWGGLYHRDERIQVIFGSRF